MYRVPRTFAYVGFWRSYFRKFPQSDIEATFDLLQRVELDHMADKRADELSGGQRANSSWYGSDGLSGSQFSSIAGN